jgi:hypothetical protein
MAGGRRAPSEKAARRGSKLGDDGLSTEHIARSSADVSSRRWRRLPLSAVRET